MQKFGIDVSHWQGDFDFAKAKANEGVEFAILKIGGGDAGLYKDVQFENNYKKCKAAELPIGVYYFGKALNMEQAEKETQHLVSLLKGKQFEYPVFYDVEADMLSTSKETLTKICKYVLSTVQNEGYWTGLYTSQSHFETEVDDKQLKSYSHWIARYGMDKPVLTSGAETQMWQYGGSTNHIRDNRINGIIVDQNYCYVDFPTKIKEAGLNGYQKTESNANVDPTTQPTSRNYAHKIGEHVVFSTCYRASTDPISKHLSATQMSKNHGVITKIVNAANPYLLDNGLCWVNDGDIRGLYQDAAPKPNSHLQIGYYPVYTGNSVSIVDSLKAVGIDSSYENRKKIADKNGITDYTGNAEQNSTMLSLLKKGKLIK